MIWGSVGNAFFVGIVGAVVAKPILLSAAKNAPVCPHTTPHHRRSVGRPVRRSSSAFFSLTPWEVIGRGGRMYSMVVAVTMMMTTPVYVCGRRRFYSPSFD